MKELPPEEELLVDFGPILEIHRDRSGYVGFARKPDPEHPRLDKHGKPYAFDHLFSIRADELAGMFPALARWLTHDSYFTLNAYYRAAPYANKLTGLPDVWRKEKHLQSLTACYADVDSGRPESTEPGGALGWRDALHRAGVLADSGVIPQPSIMARSGRGVYLFWLLVDERESDKLPRAFPEKLMLYKACNRALGDRLRTHELPADSSAVDGARVLRTPDSINTKTMRRVKYIIQGGEDGKGFVYTLPQLAEFLDIPSTTSALPDDTRKKARPVQYRKVLNPGSAPLRSKGPQSLNAMRCADLLRIEAWRGGFLRRHEAYPDGTRAYGRRRTLELYANFLRGAKAPQAEALVALRTMAQNMRPPWPEEGDTSSVERILETEYSSVKRRRYSNATLCDILNIEARIAVELDLQTIRPDSVSMEADRARPHQSELIEQRRDFARKYLSLYRRVSARTLAEEYRRQGFIGANRQTANADLNALGYVVRHVGRGRKAPQ